MNKSIIKKNDSVVVVSGKDRGSRGKVLFVDTKRDRVVVEGVNKKKKFLKPSNENPKGGVISIEYPIHLSNVMAFCEKCKKAVRLGVNISGEKKTRVCKKCNKTLD
jgi:large subunit ribosomal protein L24